MFRNLFSPDSGLMTTMNRITDCIFLSMFFILGCLPVVTVGASFAALYDSAYHGIRKGDRHSWQRFWQVYKENWKASILLGLLVMLLLYLLIRGLVGLWNGTVAGSVSWMVFSGCALAAAVAVGILSIPFPMLSRFENPFGQLVKNTVVLGLANLPRTLVLGVLNTLSFMACMYWAVPVFVLPGLAAFLGSFCIEPMFRPYMPREESFCEEEQPPEE